LELLAISLFAPPGVGPAELLAIRPEVSATELRLDHEIEMGKGGMRGGQPPFDPTMMVALLLYSYSCGIYASRRTRD
jgi:hypothetical protein